MKTKYHSYQLVLSRGNFNLLKTTISAKSAADAKDKATQIAAFYTQVNTLRQMAKANKKVKKKLTRRMEIVDQCFKLGDVSISLVQFEDKKVKAKVII